MEVSEVFPHHVRDLVQNNDYSLSFRGEPVFWLDEEGDFLPVCFYAADDDRILAAYSAAVWYEIRSHGLSVRPSDDTLLPLVHEAGYWLLQKEDEVLWLAPIRLAQPVETELVAHEIAHSAPADSVTRQRIVTDHRSELAHSLVEQKNESIYAKRSHFPARSGSAWVIGHGTETGEETFVPPGMSLHFYVADHEALDGTASLVAMALPKPKPVQTYKGTRDIAASTVPNYDFGPEKDDWDVARYVQVMADGATLRFIKGDELLCASPAACKLAKKHFCKGLLRGMSKYKELHFLTCRGPISGKSSTPIEKRSNQLSVLAKKILKEQDEDLRHAMVESLHPRDQSVVLDSKPRLKREIQGRYRKELIKELGFIGYSIYFSSLPKEERKKLLKEDVQVRLALGEAQQYITHLQRMSQPARVAAWAQLRANEREWVCRQSPRIKTWLDGQSRGYPGEVLEARFIKDSNMLAFEKGGALAFVAIEGAIFVEEAFSKGLIAYVKTFPHGRGRVTKKGQFSELRNLTEVEAASCTFL
ncbi:putative adhesin [Streptomyces wuyuanensis]|uniref:putative adhesin n=1 Tax=Streptomyces wuyuanensis TaxID=1196353 RepID=UPI00342099FE